jgi:hypothetical protein
LEPATARWFLDGDKRTLAPPPFFALFAVVKDAEYFHGSARWLQYQSVERRFIKFGRNLRFDLRAAIQPA